MIIASHEALASVREAHPNKKIVYASGAFDLLHAGHVLFFEDCKQHGDILVVGIASDAVIQHNKTKDRPILNEHQRIKIVDSLKLVDYTVLNRIPKLEDLENIFGLLKPEVYVINADAFNIPLRKAIAEKYRVQLVVLDRTCPPEFESISTSKIIEKIKTLG